MATYWVTFRIENQTIGGRTYDERYRGFQEAVRQRTTHWWLPPTSFIVFDSESDIDTLCRYLQAPLSRAHDVFLIGMPDYKSARIFGVNSDRDIYKLMPFLKEAA
jgi:hypothetical protein